MGNGCLRKKQQPSPIAAKSASCPLNASIISKGLLAVCNILIVYSSEFGGRLSTGKSHHALKFHSNLHLPSGREHFPTCSTSPSKSFVNTNRCKCYFNSRFICTFLFKSFIIYFYVTFSIQSMRTKPANSYVSPR